MKGGSKMARVFGVHTVTLNPGVKGSDLEKFITEEFYSLPGMEGITGYLVKGDRGEAKGEYLWVWEMESVEAHDRFFPSPGERSEEIQQYMAVHGEEWNRLTERWATFAVPLSGEENYTDWVVIEE
jgi:hypothetical protein